MPKPKRIERIIDSWKRIKTSSGFHNFIVYLGFVVLATLLWVVMAMNDSAQDSFDVRVQVVGVPDSITFITDPPQKIHVTVRDKGTRLFRAGFQKQHMSINFRDYASGGMFRYSREDINTSLKSIFGTSAQITSVSVDSISVAYTSDKGKRVPIIIRSDVTASSGKIISGRLLSPVTSVLLYSTTVNLDTISRVNTKMLMRRNLSDTTKVKLAIQPIPGVKIVPSAIEVTIPVEPLVKKSIMVPISIKNMDPGYSLLLFPDNVEMSYFVPMSHFNKEVKDVSVSVDFEDALHSTSSLVKLNIDSYPDVIFNPTLRFDSVEYTIVR